MAMELHVGQAYACCLGMGCTGNYSWAFQPDSAESSGTKSATSFTGVRVPVLRFCQAHAWFTYWWIQTCACSPVGSRVLLPHLYQTTRRFKNGIWGSACGSSSANRRSSFLSALDPGIVSDVDFLIFSNHQKYILLETSMVWCHFL
jgi:hypothetical protein